MCDCSPQFTPNEQLKKQLTLVLILQFIMLGIIIAFFVCGLVSIGISYLIMLLFLFASYKSILFFYLSLYIFLTLINSFQMFISIGIVLQQDILQDSNVFKNNKDLVGFGFCVFGLILNIFSIAILFPIYKEMKAQYIVASSGNNGLSDAENNNSQLLNQRNNDNNTVVSNQTNNRQGFSAFQGRGTALGGS